MAFDPSRSPTPQVIAGSSEAIAEQIVAIASAGFTFLNAALPEPDLRERFAAEVIPLVRDALGYR